MKIFGRAIVVDLSKEQEYLGAVGCEIDQPHVTVLFRHWPRFTEEELQQVETFKRLWLMKRGNAHCYFVGNRPWTVYTNFIDGDLNDFVLDAREALAILLR